MKFLSIVIVLAFSNTLPNKFSSNSGKVTVILLRTARGHVLLPRDVKFSLSNENKTQCSSISGLDAHCPRRLNEPVAAQRKRSGRRRRRRGALTWSGRTQPAAAPASAGRCTPVRGWPPAAKLS